MADNVQRGDLEEAKAISKSNLADLVPPNVLGGGGRLPHRHFAFMGRG